MFALIAISLVLVLSIALTVVISRGEAKNTFQWDMTDRATPVRKLVHTVIPTHPLVRQLERYAGCPTVQGMLVARRFHKAVVGRSQAF